MITIGYGDVNPVNVYEMIYVSVMAIFSCGVFAYCVNTIGSIFTEINQKSKQFQTKLYDISTYMNIKSITKDTQIRVLKYLEYQQDQSDEVLMKGIILIVGLQLNLISIRLQIYKINIYFRNSMIFFRHIQCDYLLIRFFIKLQLLIYKKIGESILNECSLQLREEFMKEYFGKMLQNIQILQDNYSIEFIEQLSLKMSEKLYGPGQILIQQDQIVDSLFVVTQGVVEYSMNGKDQQRQLIQIEKENKLIGFKQFLTRQICDVSIQCKTTTTIAFISYDDFYKIVKSFEYDYEKFCMMRDQFINDGRFDMKCGSCGQFGHDIQKCGQLHYCVNRPTFSRKIFQNHQQILREKKKRKIEKKINTFLINPQVKIDLKLYRWQKVQEMYQDYSSMNVIYEIQIQEKDKDFFRRCPKIKQKKIKQMSQLPLERQAMSRLYSKNFTKSQVYEQSEQNNLDTQFDLDKIDENVDSSSDTSQSSSSCSSSDSENLENSGKVREGFAHNQEILEKFRNANSQDSFQEQSVNSISFSQKNNNQGNQQIFQQYDQQQQEQYEDLKDIQNINNESQNLIEEETYRERFNFDTKSSANQPRSPFIQEFSPIIPIDQSILYPSASDQIQGFFSPSLQGIQKQSTPASSFTRNNSINSVSSKNKSTSKQQNSIFQTKLNTSSSNNNQANNTTNINQINSSNQGGNNNASHNQVGNFSQYAYQIKNYDEDKRGSKISLLDMYQNALATKKDKRNDRQSIQNFSEQLNSKKKQKPTQQQIQTNNKQPNNQILRPEINQLGILETLFEDVRRSFLNYQNKSPVNSPNFSLNLQQNNQGFQLNQQQLNLNQNQQNNNGQSNEKNTITNRKQNKEFLHSISIGSKDGSALIGQQHDTNSQAGGSIKRGRADSNLNSQHNSPEQANNMNNSSIKGLQNYGNTNNQNLNNNDNNYNYQRSIDPNDHIFGKLQFKFDKMKEFSIYYPKFNSQSIIKSYKKMQYQLYQRVKPKKAKQSQKDQMLLSSGISPVFRKQQKPLQSLFKIENKPFLSSPQTVEMTFSC